MGGSLPALYTSPDKDSAGITAEITLTVSWVVDWCWLAAWDFVLLDSSEQKPQFKYRRLSRKAGKNVSNWLNPIVC